MALASSSVSALFWFVAFLVVNGLARCRPHNNPHPTSLPQSYLLLKYTCIVVLHTVHRAACMELTTACEKRLLWLGCGAHWEPRGLRFISDFTSLSHPSCQRLIVKSFPHVHSGCSAHLHLLPLAVSLSLSLTFLQTHTQSY